MDHPLGNYKPVISMVKIDNSIEPMYCCLCIRNRVVSEYACPIGNLVRPLCASHAGRLRDFLHGSLGLFLNHAYDVMEVE